MVDGQGVEEPDQLPLLEGEMRLEDGRQAVHLAPNATHAGEPVGTDLVELVGQLLQPAQNVGDQPVILRQLVQHRSQLRKVVGQQRKRSSILGAVVLAERGAEGQAMRPQISWAVGVAAAGRQVVTEFGELGAQPPVSVDQLVAEGGEPVVGGR